MSGYEAAWFEAAELLREVYVGDDSDASIRSKARAAERRQQETPKAPTLEAPQKAAAILEDRALDLETLSADELRALGDAISPHAAAV